MMATPCKPSRWPHGTREPGALPPLHDLARLLARSLTDLEDEPSAIGRLHDQPAACVGASDFDLDRLRRGAASARAPGEHTGVPGVRPVGYRPGVRGGLSVRSAPVALCYLRAVECR
jgi:hypothetical protein